MNGSPLVTVFFIYGDCLIKKTVQAQICGSMDWIARSRVGLQLQPELDPRHKFFFTKSHPAHRPDWIIQVNKYKRKSDF